MRAVFLASFALFALACAGLASEEQEETALADQECTAPADASTCEQCLYATCEVECRACVEDDGCYECTESGAGCDQNAPYAELVSCATKCTASCTEEEPPRNRRFRGGGKGGRGGGRKPKSNSE